MEKVFAYIDRNFGRFVEELAALCRIPSVSAQKKGLDDCARHIAGGMKEIASCPKTRTNLMPRRGNST